MKYDKGAGLLHRSDHNQYKFPVHNCIPYTQGLPVPKKLIQLPVSKQEENILSESLAIFFS